MGRRQLDACVDLEKWDMTSAFNKAFATIMNPVLFRSSRYRVYHWELPVAQEERHKETRNYSSCVSWKDKVAQAEQEYHYHRHLAGLDHPGADFKAQVLVPITCVESLKVFKAFLKKGYTNQLKNIFEKEHAQDEDQQSTMLKDPFHMGAVIIPPGFSLTHVGVEIPGEGLKAAKI